MKTVILCGGLGTRLREETEFRPKPMIMIGDKPILWHLNLVLLSLYDRGISKRELVQWVEVAKGRPTWSSVHESLVFP